MHTQHPTAKLACTTIILAMIGASALAQNALDAGQPNRPDTPVPGASPIRPETITTRGRALDGNLQVGSSGFNAPIANFQRELALRNAVVTGNVAGGKAFRGDVGYSAADDFRGETGSDDLFEFQRDSAYSGLATQNIRGITPLQFQLTESTAGQTEGMLGNLIVRRSSAGVSAAETTGKGGPNLSVDPYGNLRGSLRSTSDFVLRNTRFPFVLGSLGKEEEGASRLYMAANPLIGVKAITMGNSAFTIQERPDLILEGRVSGIPNTEIENAQREGLPTPVGQRFEPTTPLDSVRSELARKADNFLSKRFDESTTTPESRGTGVDRAPAVPTESSEQRFDRMIEEMRQSFRKRLKSMEEQAPPTEEPSSQEPGADKKPQGKSSDDKSVEPTLTTQEVIANARGLLANGDVRIQALLDQNGADDLYSWHMKKGEVALRADRWFEAEERFTAALRSKPGDGMAAAGRINAQIGGSLFLSAGVNIRNLFTAYPELIPARYSAELLPSGKRLDGVRLILRDRIKRDTAFAREAALILAYLGWQTESEADTKEAFAALEAFHTNAGDEPDPLEQVLKAIWLKN
ncbi:MAG: hypothetical protein JNK58_06500 [Phycisphaerae bacterium]|nr:hypothetical protein [Phycisphaerae bacterium]